MDEQFISQNNKKESQDKEGANNQIYHNSSPDKLSKPSDNLKPEAMKNNTPTRNVVNHAELDLLEEENAETLNTKDDVGLKSLEGKINNRTNQKQRET